MSDSVSLGVTEESCIDACNSVVKVTENCVDASSREGDMGTCIRTCRDASELATVLVKLISRVSHHAATVATACADACEAAAGEGREHEDLSYC